MTLRDVYESQRELQQQKLSAYARSLIEASLDPLVTISPVGKITDVNSATENVTGVPRQRLVGSDFWRTGDEEPELLMWVSWAAHHLNNAGGTIYFERLIRPRYLGQPPDEAAVGEAVRAFEEHAKVLDGELEGRTWVLGDRLSYADFRVGTCLPFAEAAEMPLTAFPNVRRLGEQLNRLDAWREPFAGLPE